MTLALLAWLSWFVYDTYKFVQDTNTRMMGLEGARGDITHLDEVLTMSASMAAATGEVEWIDRYRGFEPKLDAAITQAIGNAQRPDIGDAIRETDVANIELVKMENRAFSLIRARRLEEARTILSGATYAGQKQLYAGGMKKLLQGLRAEQEATVESQRTATLGSILAMAAVAAVIIVAWLIVLGRVREWRTAMSKNVSELVRAEEALRESHDDLERRVTDRTRELEDEIAERKRAEEALRKNQELLKIQAATDPLTGARNRRSFVDDGEKELRRARRQNRPLSVLMMDIDHFKRINDTYGHAVGDEVLVSLVSECWEALREEDIFGRLGGEEFAAILVDNNLATARDVAERLRRTLEVLEVETSGGTFNFTVSIGVSECQSHTETLGDGLKRADEALYAAKEGGRNRIVVGSA